MLLLNALELSRKNIRVAYLSMVYNVGSILKSGYYIYTFSVCPHDTYLAAMQLCQWYIIGEMY